MLKIFHKNSIFLLCAVYFFISVFLFISLYNGQGIISPDTASYVNTAKNLLQKSFFSIDGITPDYTRTLGYPLFLAFIYALGGNNTLVVFIQVLLAVLEIYLFYRALILLRISDKFALFGTILLTLNITTIQYSWNISTDFLFEFLIVAAFYCLVNYFYGSHKSRNINIIFLAIILNYALLVRPVLLYINFFACLIFLIAWLRKKIPCWYFLAFSLCFLLVYGGWSYRNYYHSSIFTYTTINNLSMQEFYLPVVSASVDNISEEDAKIKHNKIFIESHPNLDQLNQAQISLLQKEYAIQYFQKNFKAFCWLNIYGLFMTLIAPSKTFIIKNIPHIFIAYALCGTYMLYLIATYIIYLVGIFCNRKNCTLYPIQIAIFFTSAYLALPGAILGLSRYRGAFFPLLLAGAIINMPFIFKNLKRSRITRNSFWK